MSGVANLQCTERQGKDPLSLFWSCPEMPRGLGTQIPLMLSGRLVRTRGMLGVQMFKVPKLRSSVWLSFVDLFSVGWPRGVPSHEHRYPSASPQVTPLPRRCCGAEHRRAVSESEGPDSGPAHPWSRAGQAKLHLI